MSPETFFQGAFSFTKPKPTKMKKFSIILFILAIGFSLSAQENPIKIVFDVTSPDVKVHQSAYRHAKAMAKQYPDSDFEVVIYSGALDMVLKGKSSVEKEIEELAKNEHVSFVVCQGTMKRYDVTMDDIVTGVSSVPDGILELVEKQNEGWAYIKEAR